MCISPGARTTKAYGTVTIHRHVLFGQASAFARMRDVPREPPYGSI